MYQKCAEHGVFYSNKMTCKCKYCSKDLKFFCNACESWYFCTYKKNHETTEKHQTNQKNIRNNTEEMILFTFYSGKTHKLLITPFSTIKSLKLLLFEGLSLNLKAKSYFMTTLKDNTYCYENEKISVYFENFDFFVLNEKTLIEEITDNLIIKIQNLVVSKDKTSEKKPLLGD